MRTLALFLKWGGRMTQSEKDWLLTAGKYAVALAAIAATVGGVVSLTVRPMLVEERRARESADDRIIEQLLLVTRDRLDIFEMMRTPVGPEWERKYQIIRDRWLQDDQRLNDSRKH